jgi:3-phosphoshikimate 1-carboxyvinyltransferase
MNKISLDASASSQFVTALLLLAPTLEDGLSIELISNAVSWPYIYMTNGILTNLGIQVVSQENSIRVFHKNIINSDITVEADWSAASFWYSMLSLAEKGEVYLHRLKKTGLQGDQEVSRIFSQLGVKTVEEGKSIRIVKTKAEEGNLFVDFSDHPDLALPVILACSAAGKSGTFTGLERLKFKESDRLEAISAGLAQAGIQLREEFPGTWHVEGHLAHPCDLYIKDFNDHRVAMTFAGLALKGFTIHLEHPGVVNKSYPSFWNDLEKVGFACSPSC